MKKQKFINVAYIYEAKGKNPFTGAWDYAYLTPAVETQKGDDFNYVVITCSPSMNGLYMYDASKTSTYTRWKNGSKTCLYVPIADCEFIPFSEFKPNENELHKQLLAEVKKLQKKWYTNNVKNRDYEYKRGKPDWML